MSKQDVRENYLLNMLNTMNRISTNEAGQILSVSDATVRRIFARMENSGKVIRDYGGIQLAKQGLSYSFEESEHAFRIQKQKIGLLAASFVQDEETIYLDCGTTLFQMALALNERIISGELKSLNIITNSIANLQAITPPPTGHVILVGGEYNKNRRDFSGPLTEKYVALFHFNKSFFGCDGFDDTMGFSSNQIEISSLNTLVIKRTDQSFCLMDSSKYAKRSLISYAGVHEIGSIVTEAAPPPSLEETLAEAKVMVYIAPASARA